MSRTLRPWGLCFAVCVLGILRDRPAYTQPAPQAVLQPTKNALDLGLVVRDLEVSLKFYQGVLGLEKAGEFQTPFGPMVRLRFGESDLKLIAPKAPPPAGP